MSNLKWNIVAFGDLDLFSFHDIIQLREKVFVVEQNCPYLDVDGKDTVCHHVVGMDSNQKIVATARILPPKMAYKEVSIGRICTDPNYRGKNIGHELMKQAIVFIENHYHTGVIRLSAQTYLLKFYETYLFRPLGDTYLEDGIPHIEMLRS